MLRKAGGMYSIKQPYQGYRPHHLQEENKEYTNIIEINPKPGENQVKEEEFLLRN